MAVETSGRPADRALLVPVGESVTLRNTVAYAIEVASETEVAGVHFVAPVPWHDIDDVAFTRAVLDDLARVVNVDADRVFATGMSNGGIMAYRVASELSDRIAAIAPVGRPMGTETCSPNRPVSVMHFHGTDDAFAAFHRTTYPEIRKSTARTE